ncbi:MAG: Tol-Pal system beta propeller repeat protein TolB [Oligoflexia bacterium]|nr:Tol-Pal system beta propeller repeat protein TolB [Oligoflexia bacterium]
MTFPRALTFLLACGLAMTQTVPAFAEDKPYIPVGTARSKKTVLALAATRVTGDGALAKHAQNIRDTVNNDLAFMDMFQLLSPAAFIEDAKTAGLTPETFKMGDWSSIGAEILVKSGLALEGGNLSLEAYVYETASGRRLLGKRYVAAQGDAKATAHTFANDIVTALTGLPGIFMTKIAMSCDRGGKKEVYVMDFDGTNVRQITAHRSIAFAPAWSPDGTRIAYSLYTKHRRNIKNIDLYEFDFASSTHRLLSNRKGINSGAAYSPDGRKIALTMSFLGNPDIFVLDPATKTVERLTKSASFDVDPVWSPDGRRLAFVSSRSGGPMVFSMNDDGSNVQRLTYAGRYNATPSWSPQNNKIAFAGWIDRGFDIFIMNPDGSHIERLTKNQGNNEDAHFSPDGNFIVFSSNRTGQKNIYVMNVDGTFVKRLTYGLGNCVTPKWSSPPK